MFRKFLALVPVLAAAALAAPGASATTLDPYGTAVNPDPDDWNAPKEAPYATCHSLMLYLADLPADAARTRRYRFTGTCKINVAREGKLAKMVELEVLVDGEYSPKMKRASERVTVKHPDISLDLTTWATCATDPFVGTNVVCTDKGMGATKWDKFINKDSAPIARQRATQAQADDAANRWAKAKAKGATDADFYKAAEAFRIQPLGGTKAGSEKYMYLEVKGGGGVCPAEFDFGDGTPKEKIIVWSTDPYLHYVKHTYAKPGFFKVSVRPLPGCTSEPFTYALVK